MRRADLIVVAMATALVPAAMVHGQLIRPDSATATSVFSSGYVVANAINGSGMPTNFVPTDAHATYVSGNHWTTANGHTVGESATFFFTTPQTIGTFHMWAHRSNGVASNPNYAATEFELVFRDAANTVLLSRPCMTGYANIATAQTYRFAPVQGVSSVEFIVRATLNGNVSPYTGLAEVAFEAAGSNCAADLTLGAVPGAGCYGVPDGKLNNEDFFYYLGQFAAGNLAVADLTTGAIPGQPGYGAPNGILNNEDFFYYLAIFAAGC